MTKRNHSARHQYDIEYIFENEHIDKWNEILAWEEANHFIRAIPLQNNFHAVMKTYSNGNHLLHVAARHANPQTLHVLQPFIEHLLQYFPDAFTRKNHQQHTPLEIAIHSSNVHFVQMVLQLLFLNKPIYLERLNAQFIECTPCARIIEYT
jgi:hypothetical protein